VKDHPAFDCRAGTVAAQGCQSTNVWQTLFNIALVMGKNLKPRKGKRLKRPSEAADTHA